MCTRRKPTSSDSPHLRRTRSLLARFVSCPSVVRSFASPKATTTHDSCSGFSLASRTTKIQVIAPSRRPKAKNKRARERGRKRVIKSKQDDGWMWVGWPSNGKEEGLEGMDGWMYLYMTKSARNSREVVRGDCSEITAQQQQDKKC